MNDETSEEFKLHFLAHKCYMQSGGRGPHPQPQPTYSTSSELVLWTRSQRVWSKRSISQHWIKWNAMQPNVKPKQDPAYSASQITLKTTVSHKYPHGILFPVDLW